MMNEGHIGVSTFAFSQLTTRARVSLPRARHHHDRLCCSSILTSSCISSVFFFASRERCSIHPAGNFSRKCNQPSSLSRHKGEEAREQIYSSVLSSGISPAARVCLKVETDASRSSQPMSQHCC